MASGPTTQKPIELILARQLASYLAMPIFLVDAAGRSSSTTSPPSASSGFALA